MCHGLGRGIYDLDRRRRGDSNLGQSTLDAMKRKPSVTPANIGLQQMKTLNHLLTISLSNMLDPAT
jgi:hypothetical protein